MGRKETVKRKARRMIEKEWGGKRRITNYNATGWVEQGRKVEKRGRL